MIYQEDKGSEFGKWNDQTSRFMYYDSTAAILRKIPIPKRVADYGGGNGLIKQFIQQAITIDIDPQKKPDILDNILTHEGNYELIILRYVLHYLTDYEIIRLFFHIQEYHRGHILIQQFYNDELQAKYLNSDGNEATKYFRTRQQLLALLPPGEVIYESFYTVTPEFYLNRLGIQNAIKHQEAIIGYYI